MRVAPGDAEAQGLLGEAYLYSKSYKEAVASLTEAVRLAPTAKDWQDSLKKAQEAMNSPAGSKAAGPTQTRICEGRSEGA